METDRQADQLGSAAGAGSGGRGFRGGVAALLAAYAVFLAFYFAPVPSGADSAGYINEARLLLRGRLTAPIRTWDDFAPESPWTYTPLGFTQAGTRVGELTPTYPTGLPLHLALASWFLGWTWGPLAVGVGASIAGVALTYLLLRELGLDAVLSLAGAAALGVSPQFLYVSFTPMSDVPALAWLTAGVVGALRTRHSPAWGGWAGLAFSMAVLIRPTCAVVALPFAFLVRGRKAWLWLVAGAFPAAAWQYLVGSKLYGGGFGTGYGSIGALFGPQFLGATWQNYLVTLPIVLPLAVPAVLLAGLLPWRTQARVWGALAAVVLGLFGFYSFYRETGTVWWYLRFVLPTFPILVAAGLLGLRRLAERSRGGLTPRRRGSIAIAVVAVSLVASVVWSREKHVLMMKRFQEPYEAAGVWAREHLPADAGIVSMHLSGALYFYVENPILRWDLVSDADVTSIREHLRRTDQLLYAMVYDFEGDQELHRKFPWAWEEVAEFSQVTVWSTRGDAPP